MYKILSYAIIAFAAMAITACDEVEGITVEEIEVPEGYELSAGTSTIFFNSPLAYDQPADWIAGAYDSRFNSGDRLYDNVKTIILRMIPLGLRRQLSFPMAPATGLLPPVLPAPAVRI